MNAPAPAWNRNFRRRQGDEPSVVAELPHRRGVAIGSRWNPSHAIVRDPDSGVFYERNPPMESAAELDVQKALLTQRANNRGRWWALALALPFVVYVGCRMVWP